MPEIFEETIRDIITQIGSYLPTLLGALAILFIGWLVALLIAAIVRGVLRRTTLDNRLASWFVGEEAGKAIPVEKWTAKGVYYLVMLFVLVAFFQILGLSLVTEPINRFLTQVLEFAPRLLGAALLLLIAWAVASIVKLILSRVLGAAKLDERLGSGAGLEEEQQISVTKPLTEAVYWLIFLLFLPMVLGTLELQGLLEPVQGMLNKVLGFLPNIFTAGLILAVGWFVARLVQRIVTNLSAAVGANQLSENVGLAPALGGQPLSRILGLIVYMLILIPVLIAALNALALDAITQPASNMLDKILAAIPALFGAALLVAIAYVVGHVAGSLITNVLTVTGFNTVLSKLGLGKETAEGKQTPSAIVGNLVWVVIVFFGTIEAARLLGFLALSDLLTQFVVFASHVGLGLVIFALGLYLASLASKTVLASGVIQASLLALVARIAILVLAGSMALRQVGVANEIIILAFGLVLGGITLALALAIGLGGREIAARQLEEWVKEMKSRES